VRYAKMKHFCTRQMHPLPLSVVPLLAILAVLSPKFSRATDTLTVLSGAVQKAEDSPAVSSSYEFLPGDFLYFSFRVAGFKTRTQSNGNNEAKSISLTYEAAPLDERSIALCPPVTGVIETELNAEDKDWTPNREISFILPSFLAAGTYHVHLKLQDKFGNEETARDFPFRIGGTRIAPSSNLNVQNFAFLRKETDREALQVPAYSPGDTVFARFDIAGFKVGEKNSYRLAYGVTVLRPDGKPFVSELKAAELEQTTYYPAPYVPGLVQISVPPGSPRGQYVLSLHVRDLLAGTEYETRRALSIE
jgi:hypothetical protein